MSQKSTEIVVFYINLDLTVLVAPAVGAIYLSWSSLIFYFKVKKIGRNPKSDRDMIKRNRKKNRKRI